MPTSDDVSLFANLSPPVVQFEEEDLESLPFFQDTSDDSVPIDEIPLLNDSNFDYWTTLSREAFFFPISSLITKVFHIWHLARSLDKKCSS
jgi:hypothetical protein